MLEIKNLKRSFGQEVAVDSATLSIEDNSIVALISQSNTIAKTTLIGLISGHLIPDEGHLFFNGVNIVPLNPYQRKKQGLSCVALEDYLFNHLTIADHVLAVARNASSTINELYAQWRLDSQFLKKSFTALASAGVDLPMETKISELSPIKKKMLSLGLAMLEPFELLVWEDPLKGISKESYPEIEKLIIELKRKQKSVFFTCTDSEFAKKVADKQFIMQAGRISNAP